MKGAEHGGNVLQVAAETGISPEEILDFSASINPLGIPETVLAAARDVLLLTTHYPEIDAASFVRALAGYHGLPPENLLAGSGSTELIYLFPRVMRPKRATIVAPAFSEYGRALAQIGTALDLFPLTPDDSFAFDPQQLLTSLSTETDLVVLANPGNPNGAGIDPAAVEAVACGLAGRGILLVDEAFVDFCPQRSVIEKVVEHGNLYILRSLTKFYAIPGLRAGYLAGPVDGVARLLSLKEPWTLSTPAIAAAKACLNEDAYRKKAIEEIPLLRRLLAKELKEVGLNVFPSEVNYLLARIETEGVTAADLADSLRKRGILIRDCATFLPLDGRYLRVAVRSEGENRRLVEELRTILSGTAS